MRPLIHLAFDTLTIGETLGLLEDGLGEGADVIECGGPLIFNEGVKALGAVKAAYPDKEVVADIKIVPLLTRYNAAQFFEAGADAMIVFGTSSETDMAAAMEVAKTAGKRFYVFIDLPAGALPSRELMEMYRRAGVENVIFHTVRGRAPYWQESDVESVRLLSEAGFATSPTGKLSVDDIALFAGLPIYSFILGTSIVEAKDPEAALARYKDVVEANFS